MPICSKEHMVVNKYIINQYLLYTFLSVIYTFVSIAGIGVEIGATAFVLGATVERSWLSTSFTKFCRRLKSSLSDKLCSLKNMSNKAYFDLLDILSDEGLHLQISQPCLFSLNPLSQDFLHVASGGQSDGLTSLTWISHICEMHFGVPN